MQLPPTCQALSCCRLIAGTSPWQKSGHCLRPLVEKEIMASAPPATAVWALRHMSHSFSPQTPFATPPSNRVATTLARLLMPHGCTQVTEQEPTYTNLSLFRHSLSKPPPRLAPPPAHHPRHLRRRIPTRLHPARKRCHLALLMSLWVTASCPASLETWASV